MDLNQTNYFCVDCRYDPSDGDDEELLELPNDIDTAHGRDGVSTAS